MNLQTYVASVGQRHFSESVGVSQSMVSQWIRGRRPVSAVAALRIEHATSGMVSRKDLFPGTWHLIWPELHHATKDDTV